MNQTHVVFGAAGGLGLAIVNQLASQGQPTRAVVRDVAKAKQLLPTMVEIVKGDVLDVDSTREVSSDAVVIYQCANALYNRWAEFFPAANENAIVAAQTSGARLLFPGNVYGYGRFQTSPFNEQHPLAATSKKGKLRNQLEARLWQAHRDGVPVVIPRMPDFYGPNITNRTYGGAFQAALKGKKAEWIGKLDQPHELVYINDAAAACVLLAGTEAAYGQVWHVAGAGPLTGRQFIETIFRQAETAPHIGTINAAMLRLVSPFMPLAGEMVELMYEYNEPYMMDGSKFASAFPDFRFTPHEEAIRCTLDWFRQHPDIVLH